jgi:hypothetical protein
MQDAGPAADAEFAAKTELPAQAPGSLTYAQVKAAVNEIAGKLREADYGPRRQIQLLVETTGLDFAYQLLQEALEIEANGGLMVESGERRRTPGGVYFHLARKYLPDDLREGIFHQWRARNRRFAEQELQYPVLEWEERLQIVSGLLEAKGALHDVRITLTGRPGAIERRQNLVMTTMEFPVAPGAFPNGVPIPPQTHVTYVVYMASRQWENVARAMENAYDQLIVEGLCIYDPELGQMAVYGSNVTTRQLRRREQQLAQGEQGKGARDARDKGKGRGPRQDRGERADRPDRGGHGGRPQPSPVKERQNEPERGSVSKREAAPEPVPHKDAPSSQDIPAPAGLPPEAAQRWIQLQTAAASFRQKIADIESKPAGQQSGLEMTAKLLRNTERQIEALEKQYGAV